MDLPRPGHVAGTDSAARTGRGLAIVHPWWWRHAPLFLVLATGAAARVAAPGPLSATGSLQLLLGLATGTLVHVLLLRWGVAGWLAALAVVPVCWDAGRMAGGGPGAPTQSLAVVLGCCALLLLFWRAHAGTVAAFLAGAVTGAATALHPAVAPLVLVLLLAVTTGQNGRKDRAGRALVVVLGWTVAAVPYAVWHRSAHGELPLGAAAQPVLDLGTASQGAASRPGAALVAVLVAGFVLGLLAAAGVGRAGASRMRSTCLVVSLAPVAVLVGALATDASAWGHLLPALALLPAAGALGLTALCRGRRGPSVARPQIDGVDRSALAGFRERYGEPALAPVVVVIAAYNEAGGLPQVLSTMPTSVCGLPTDVVVVDDASTDGTAEVVGAHGRAYAVPAAVNRGQGAALRLGYRIAREHGAQYIVTTDADGQYDTADFPAVLSPLLHGSADFVTGSRRLGRHHSDDRFRRAGVVVFAWAVTVLTGQRLTDTSFGLRAMRAEVTGAVTLNQPQYQSSELLIGVLSHGYRVVEVPGTMHLRAAGTSKKGGNLRYGLRYAGVVLGTWWREGCPSPVRGGVATPPAQPTSTGTPPTPG